eukprot:TRINITY_DN12647_c0_g3_i1.p1 TRINITY_DN12647_c0_g3~~TRINITY_DN12647_c0_g3_i1.p1  ORF type:complete len:206 (+),score=40.40 TRINITY_DN12647_c0_g3_i1:364-981(+)
MGYINKAQTETSQHHIKAVLRAMQRSINRRNEEIAQARDAGQPEPPVNYGLRTLLSMMYKMSGQRWIGKVMAAYYVMYDDFAVRSHPFKNVLIKQAIAHQDGLPISGIVTTDQDNANRAKIVPSTFDYVYRPNALNNVSYLRFHLWVYKATIPTDEDGDPVLPEAFDVNDEDQPNSFSGDTNLLERAFQQDGVPTPLEMQITLKH